MNWDLDEQTFAAWAPAGVIWSEWAKPVAFVSAHELIRETAAVVEETRIPLTLDSSSAVVIDLPGAEAVHVGLILFERGFCPVPLFNATSGPSPVIDMTAVTRALVTGVERLKQRQIPPTAPPAFLLDSRRGGAGITLKAGVYDNRWVTLPQDFPSAALLASRGIRNATLLRRGSRTGTLLQPGSPAIPLDLAHVLRRWQDQGIVIRVVDVATGETADNVTVPKPSGFRLAWYAAIALLGLRRSNVGGFGSSIPEQTSGGGYG